MKILSSTNYSKFYRLFCSIITLSVLILLPLSIFAQSNNLIEAAKKSLMKGSEYFHSINIKGGYVYFYTLDLKEKWGEGTTDDSTIEVQSPGTPAVGMAFINAYKATGEKTYLTYAEDAANALIAGQNKYGGWDHKIYFGENDRRPVVSFDDNQTQGAIRFLMSLDQLIQNEKIHTAVIKALDCMLTSQWEIGAWPHMYPKQGNYHDYATFNDAGINDCINVMMDAYKYYKDDRYLESIKKAGHYIFISQYAPPQSGWAAQYNEFLQPAWARTFEPPSLDPACSIRNINSLIDIYLLTHDKIILEPIPDAIRWLAEIRLPNGKWPRFVELGTNKPIYYDRGRIRVKKYEDLSLERFTGYGYEQNLIDQLQETIDRYNEIKDSNINNYVKKLKLPLSKPELEKKINNLHQSVQQIINDQDNLGRWISKNDKYKAEIPNYKWNGQYIVKDRLSSEEFNNNINTLSEFLLLMKDKEK